MISLPPPLQSGDTVGLLSPSGSTTAAALRQGSQVLKSFGLQVVNAVYATHQYETFYRFSGSDTQRLSDLQKMLDHPDLRAILCLRGGYGLTRIQDRLDFTAFRRFPKWVVGFSDVTALHLQLHRLGYASLHAAMPAQFGRAGIAPALESLRAALLGEPFEVAAEAPTLCQSGTAEGHIVGGNLSLVVNALGTPSELDTEGKILLLEEVGEAAYAVDRMLIQLRRSGRFSGIIGCVLGSFTNESNAAYSGQIRRVLEEHFGDAPFPVADGFPVGHTVRNEAILLGVKAKLSVSETAATVRFAGRPAVA